MASAANVLAIEVACEARDPWSSSQQACISSARVAAMSISLSATICWIMPSSPSRAPNASRSATWRDRHLVAAARGPSHRITWVIRAGPSRTCA